MGINLKQPNAAHKAWGWRTLFGKCNRKKECPSLVQAAFWRLDVDIPLERVVSRLPDAAIGNRIAIQPVKLIADAFLPHWKPPCFDVSAR